MRQFLTLIMFTVSVNSFAGKIIEFDHSQEVKCHEEIKALGCAGKSDEELGECVDKKKTKLSQSCRDIHQVKKDNSSI